MAQRVSWGLSRLGLVSASATSQRGGLASASNRRRQTRAAPARPPAHNESSRDPSSEDPPEGPTGYAGRPSSRLCAPSLDTLPPSGPQSPQPPSPSPPQAENLTVSRGQESDDVEGGVGQEATEGVNEEPSEPPGCSSLPADRAPHQSPPLGPLGHTRAAEQWLLTAGRPQRAATSKPAGPRWAGRATRLWPEGFVSGTQDTTQGWGWLPSFPHI